MGPPCGPVVAHSRPTVNVSGRQEGRSVSELGGNTGSPHRDTEQSLGQGMKPMKGKGEIRHLEQQKSSETINEPRYKSTKVLPGDTGESLHQGEESEFV